jgi:transposase-like protein
LRPRFRHERINHSVSYVEGDIHTNGIENFWSLLKRGLVGSFHKVSVKHLTRYLDEFTFRFNERKVLKLVDLVLANCERKHMPYAELIG